MRVLFFSFVIVIGLMVSLPPDGFANHAKNSTTSETQIHNSSFSVADSHRAKLWQLNEREWQQYQSLMRGPRGIWSPGLDPLSVLGIAATTDAERQHYAEKLAKLERTRLQQELLFEASYQQTQKRLFGNVPLFANNQPFANRTPAKQQRRLYFVKLPCDSCKQQLASLLSSIHSHPLDIYLQGAKSDAEIRQWATRMEISTEWVTTRKITLNHDRGLAKQAGVTQFPALMQKRDSSWKNSGAKQ